MTFTCPYSCLGCDCKVPLGPEAVETRVSMHSLSPHGLAMFHLARSNSNCSNSNCASMCLAVLTWSNLALWLVWPSVRWPAVLGSLFSTPRVTFDPRSSSTTQWWNHRSPHSPQLYLKRRWSRGSSNLAGYVVLSVAGATGLHHSPASTLTEHQPCMGPGLNQLGLSLLSRPRGSASNNWQITNRYSAALHILWIQDSSLNYFTP